MHSQRESNYKSGSTVNLFLFMSLFVSFMTIGTLVFFAPNSFASGVSEKYSKFLPMTLARPVLQFNYFKDFTHIMSRLHRNVEQDTDVFFIVNTSAARSTCQYRADTLNLPPQHLMMVERISRGAPVFLREGERIVGLNLNNVRIFGKSTRVLQNYQVTSMTSQDKMMKKLREDRDLFIRESGMMNPVDFRLRPVTPFVPISSGVPGGSRILTYSGIFRVNEERTNLRRNSTNTLSDPMQFSIYIDGEYNDQREAALALHGTTPNHWPKLGQQRASSGCIRVHTDFSEWARYYLFYRSSDSPERNFQDLLLNPSRSSSSLIARPELVDFVPSWNRRDHYPPTMEDYSRLSSRPRLRVLFIFYDQDNQRSCI
jgi:hypothetical protein